MPHTIYGQNALAFLQNIEFFSLQVSNSSFIVFVIFYITQVIASSKVDCEARDLNYFSFT